MTSFRPRPIDIDKPLLIVREEITEETRSIPAFATGMEQHEENEAHIKQAIIEAQQNNTRLQANIPTPIVREVADFEKYNADDWERPGSYIKVLPPSNPIFSDPLAAPSDYDFDSDDSYWLENLNKKSKVLSVDDFELFIDILEKSSARQKFLLNGLSQESTISLETAKESINDAKKGTNPQVIESVYNYWLNKREALRRPLIISLLDPPSPDNPSPLIAFRPREKETKKRVRKNNQHVLLQLKKLRAELERGRTILELVKKREVLKKERLEYKKKMLEIRFVQKSRLAEKNSTNVPLTDAITSSLTAFSLEDSSGESNDEYFSDSELKENAEPEEREREWEWDHFPGHQYNRELNYGNRKVWGKVTLPGIPPFRGRVRIGRGGRLLIDRSATDSLDQFS